MLEPDTFDLTTEPKRFNWPVIGYLVAVLSGYAWIAHAMGWLWAA